MRKRVEEARARRAFLIERWNHWRAEQRLESNPTCQFGPANACAPDRICAFLPSAGAGDARCFPRYAGSTRFLRFPFHSDHPVVCTRGPLAAESGHARLDTLYAITLASPAAGEPGRIYAGMAGVAIVFKDCDPALRGAEAQNCGQGLGIHVRILDERGYVLLYSHLASVAVADGQTVRVGDEIGVEGSTGRTSKGGPELELSLHQGGDPVAGSWVETLAYYRGHPGVVPPSIPFETEYCDPRQPRRCARVRKRAEELPCGAGRSALDAGLRGDWRD